MRRLDEFPIDPEIAAELDAIDATLAGEPVDPSHAELAELALMLAAERPDIDEEFARSLDARVARRFGPAPTSAPAEKRSRRWMWKPVAGTLAAGMAAVVVVVAVNSAGSGGTSGFEATPAFSTTSAAASTSASAGAASGSVRSAQSSAAPTASGSAGGAGAATSSSSPQPESNGRKIVRSASLSLTTAPAKVDAVAQEVFDVVGRENGIVGSSHVTATGGTDGYAEFQLRIPSGSLTDAMSALSQLRYAHVASRTDNTQDVNGAYVSVTHQLADARALRTALLKQLAGAVTQAQIDSLNARIHDAEASIASDEATIRGLNNKINFSQVSVTINAANAPTAPHHSSSGFTIGKAAHDAGRVLTVAAGVALISLAALVPVLLVGALIWWIASAIRHRRREQALDAA